MTHKEILRLSIEEMPRSYYNIAADLKIPLSPPLHPATMEPIGPEDLAPLFPMELIKQEVTQERYITIPEPVREIYSQIRPTPIYRAKRLEDFLDTGAKIYYKYEGVSPAGSHKTNTAIPQAYYNHKEGVEKLVTETGAGQWGTALSYATSFFDMELEIFMVRVSYDTKPYRKTLMKLFNDKTIVHPSPSRLTEFGNKLLDQNPNHPGSLGIAIGEAIEQTMKTGSKYSLGSVLNHVLIHQTIIGQEAKIQMNAIDNYPDIIIGCVGGGSNLAGLAYPFIKDKIEKKYDTEIIAVESEAAPKMTKGQIGYDFGDSGQMTPLLRMYSIGSDFIPPPVHAGGLRYHGLAPTLTALLEQNLVIAKAYPQVEVFDAAKIFIQTEGIIPAPESSHAIVETIKQARKIPKGTDKTILFNLSGHGYLDLLGYEEYLQGTMQDHVANATDITKSIQTIKISN
ncbi:MAG: Tryptophan synthase beta chain 1 [Candidatus Heimdallarchaeota archaeon LC_2]|nr:MAG: Tryptophan synthase beta chain 1 [Candidatus Heimdallarchaeota archaeon LC_2]OLS21486.1 MAG: Tryptophan synthase beta chain 1 [Candidatus Heimdallarchaeota archaeon LC_2]